MSETPNRFMQAADVKKEKDPWATVEWLSNQELVGAEELLMVRATIEAGRSIQLAPKCLLRIHPKISLKRSVTKTASM
jgi:hypothetical protein